MSISTIPPEAAKEPFPLRWTIPPEWHRQAVQTAPERLTPEQRLYFMLLGVGSRVEGLTSAIDDRIETEHRELAKAARMRVREADEARQAFRDAPPHPSVVNRAVVAVLASAGAFFAGWALVKELPISADAQLIASIAGALAAAPTIHQVLDSPGAYRYDELRRRVRVDELAAKSAVDQNLSFGDHTERLPLASPLGGEGISDSRVSDALFLTDVTQHLARTVGVANFAVADLFAPTGADREVLEVATKGLTVKDMLAQVAERGSALTVGEALFVLGISRRIAEVAGAKLVQAVATGAPMAVSMEPMTLVTQEPAEIGKGAPRTGGAGSSGARVSQASDAGVSR